MRAVYWVVHGFSDCACWQQFEAYESQRFFVDFESLGKVWHPKELVHVADGHIQRVGILHDTRVK